VFAYNIKSNQWAKIKPNIEIPKVDSHSAVLSGQKMYVYGGYISEKAIYLTDIYAFDL
jgi:N-acetylneuraminic acid mutarotase